ncbi:hypothetical protein [Nocardiopsis deserti]|uniref:hypothetical protein n=1 Tax=Nocardiopsis deserti TaxID=2605988 RepID=UPI00123B4F71|nr:hypothetical protein [Nocardiopsis deserti]
MVIRNRGMQIISCILAFLVWVLPVLWMGSGEFQLNDAFFASTVMGMSIWLSVKIGFWRSIEIGDGFLIVRDYLTKTSVPMAQIRDIVAPGGALVIELKNGDSLKPAAFEGSLLTALFGSPSANRAVRILNQGVSESAVGDVAGDAGNKMSPHLNLLAFPVIWVLVFFSYLGLSFLAP